MKQKGNVQIILERNSAIRNQLNKIIAQKNRTESDVTNQKNEEEDEKEYSPASHISSIK